MTERYSQEDRQSRAGGPGNRGTNLGGLKGRRAEALAAQQTLDSGFGKPRKPDRPTADEVLANVDGAGNVPFDALPPMTRAELLRRGGASEPNDMFKGEAVGVGVRDSETGRG